MDSGSYKNRKRRVNAGSGNNIPYLFVDATWNLEIPGEIKNEKRKKNRLLSHCKECTA